MSKPGEESSSGLEIRFTELSDGKYLKQWLSDEEVSSWFPMMDEIEIDDAVLRWIAFYRYNCSITAVKDGVPVGIATLYLQPYLKLAHQCEFGIIVGQGNRGKGVGSLLLNSVMHLAKEKFKIELIHLQVYAENPAMNLYKRFGFKEFGRQEGWIKEKDKHVGRVFMERYI
jgi:putative acetyltransferase